VKLRGAGKATLWAVEGFDVAINGLGSVEYFGSGMLKKSVSGFANATSLGIP